MLRSRDTRDLYRALARDNTPLLALISLGARRYGLRCRFASELYPKRCRATL
jgi:predicted kinase